MDILIKSPLNYTGNKFRILKQLLPYMPKDIDIMVDVFCGGATVGSNVPCKKVIFIDSNKAIIQFLEYLADCKDVDKLIRDLISLTDKYKLTCSGLNGYSMYKQMLIDKTTNNGLKEINQAGFYELRSDYNAMKNRACSDAFNRLYLLMVYGFNNDIRFSREGNYNLPIGKTDLNKNNLNKIKMFVERMSTIKYEFVCAEFDSPTAMNYIQSSDFTYLDPPYLITNAVYNESGGWSYEAEHRLLALLDGLLKENRKFMLSNVIEKKGRKNEPLYYWTTLNEKNIQIIDIDYHYRSASYNKINRYACEREIIIVPKGSK